jgi:hypothetical protein
MGPSLSGMFRRGIGYGAYGVGDEVEAPIVIPVLPIIPMMISTASPAPASAPTPTAAPKFFGLDKKTLVYVVGGIILFKLLF